MTTALLLSYALYACVVCTIAGTIPDTTAATSDPDVTATSHELDLTNLSLPPEVITEALFSQVDLIQDKLEQCEETVRNSLKGDSSHESVDIDDDDDMSEDRSEEIAQLAIDRFSSATTTSAINNDNSFHNDIKGGMLRDLDGDNINHPSNVLDTLDDENHKNSKEQKEEHNQGQPEEETDESNDDTGDDNALKVDNVDIITGGQRDTETDSNSSDARTSSEKLNSVKILNEREILDNGPKSGNGAEKTGDDSRERTEGMKDWQGEAKNFTNLRVEQQDQSLHDTEDNLQENSGEVIAPLQDSLDLEELDEAADKESVEIRSKRSLSLERIMTNIAEAGTDNWDGNAAQITLGTGKIQRQPVRSEELLQREITQMKQDMQMKQEKQATEADSERMTHEEHSAADEFTKTRPTLLPHKIAPIVKNIVANSVNSEILSQTSRHRDRSEVIKIERLVATTRNPSKTERRRIRRSVTEHLSPERYVPLIGRLVDRLKYLKHSLAVCHALLNSDYF